MAQKLPVINWTIATKNKTSMNFVQLKSLLLKALPHNNSLQHGRLRSLQMVVNQTFEGLRRSNASPNGKTVVALLKFLRPKRPRKATLMVTVVSSIGLAGYGLRASSGLLTPQETFHR